MLVAPHFESGLQALQTIHTSFAAAHRTLRFFLVEQQICEPDANRDQPNRSQADRRPVVSLTFVGMSAQYPRSSTSSDGWE